MSTPIDELKMVDDLNAIPFDETIRRRQFILGLINIVDIPSGLPKRSDFWGVRVNIDGNQYVLGFSYNRISKQYSLTLSKNGLRVRKHYLELDDPLDLPGLNIENGNQPDVSIVVADVQGVGGPITADTLNKGEHEIWFMLGNFEVLDFL